MNSGLNFIGVLLQTLLALAAVCGLAYVIFRVILPKLQITPGSGNMIRIVERIGIDTRRSLLVVEVADKWLLLSVGENGVRLITELNEAEARTAESEILLERAAQYQKIEEFRSGFAAKLASVMGKKSLPKETTEQQNRKNGKGTEYADEQ